jgi:hypothetical protein
MRTTGKMNSPKGKRDLHLGGKEFVTKDPLGYFANLGRTPFAFWHQSKASDSGLSEFPPTHRNYLIRSPLSPDANAGAKSVWLQ